MKTSFVTKTLGVLALLASSASMAASVQIIPSASVLTAGQTFTLTVQSDAGNTFAATMGLAFDATRIAYVSGAVAGAFSPGVFTKNSAVTANPTVFDIEAVTKTSASPGTYTAAVLTFQVLNNVLNNTVGIGPTTSLVTINDDGGFQSGWFDADSFDYIPSTYSQATLSISAVPVPGAVWLLGSAVGLLGLARRRAA